MKWYKASNRLIDDPKLRVVSKKAGVKHIETVVTLHSLLERCSQNNTNSFGDIDLLVFELEVQLELPAVTLDKILKELDTFKIIRGNIMINWDKNQVSESYERVKKWREKQKEKQNVTECSVTDTQIRIDKIRVDKNKEEDVFSEIKKEVPLAKVRKKKEPTNLEKYPDWLTGKYAELWLSFMRMRLEKYGFMTATAQQAALNRLEKWKNEGFDIVEIMENTIQNEWKGFFNTKEKPSFKPKAPPVKSGNDVTSPDFFDKAYGGK